MQSKRQGFSRELSGGGKGRLGLSSFFGSLSTENEEPNASDWFPRRLPLLIGCIALQGPPDPGIIVFEMYAAY